MLFLRQGHSRKCASCGPLTAVNVALSGYFMAPSWPK